PQAPGHRRDHHAHPRHPRPARANRVRGAARALDHTRAGGLRPTDPVAAPAGCARRPAAGRVRYGATRHLQHRRGRGPHAHAGHPPRRTRPAASALSRLQDRRTDVVQSGDARHRPVTAAVPALRPRRGHHAHAGAVRVHAAVHHRGGAAGLSRGLRNRAAGDACLARTQHRQGGGRAPEARGRAPEAVAGPDRDRAGGTGRTARPDRGGTRVKGPEFDLSQPLGGPRWGEGRRDSRSDRVVGEGFLGATTSSDAAATEIGRIVDDFLGSMRAALGQVLEALPVDAETLAPVRDIARTVDTALATGDVSMLSGLVDSIQTAGEIVAARVTGGYEVDEFGFDEHFHRTVWLPLWRPLFEHWFRVEVIGAENIPATDSGLIVSNHAGVLPLDGLMTTVAVNDHGGRPLRLLAADLAMTLPVSAPFARRAGATLACAADAERLLEAGHVVA